MTYKIKNSLIFYAFILSFICCKPSAENKFRKLTNAEVLSQVEAGTFKGSEDMDYYDSLGHKINIDSFYLTHLPRDIKTDFYVNSENELKKIVVRIATEEDKAFFDTVNNVAVKSAEEIQTKNVRLVTVDCVKKKDILLSILKRDLDNRLDGFEGIDPKVDRRNLEILVSLYEECDDNLFDDLEEIHGRAIFLTIQHSDPYSRSVYYSYIEKAYTAGIISNQQLALLEDRMLMDDNKPQKYGTQIRGNKLYIVDNMDSVVVRRANMDMVPLEEYLEGFK